MSHPRDDWDADERAAFDGRERELEEIRQRHADDPSLAMLRSAAADALPPDMQADVARHLQDSAWSRTLVEGLRDAAADVRLDDASEERLFQRITREARTAPARRWQATLTWGGLAVAATVLLAVMVTRGTRDGSSVSGTPSGPPDREANARGTARPPGAAPILIAFNRPDVKLSPSALTWRGDPAANPFLRDLAPAFDAYRAGDDRRAVAQFDRLATVYPDSIEVLFYQGVSRMLAGDDAGAVAPLEAAARLGSPAFEDDVAWYLAVAQQRSGRPGTRDRFAALCRGKGRHASEACAAAERLGPSPRRP